MMNYKYQNNRFVPFAGPFLLGALTGGVAVGALGPRPRPYYPPYPPFPPYGYPVYYR